MQFVLQNVTLCVYIYKLNICLIGICDRYVVKNRYLSTFQGLQELEASLPEFVTQPRIKAPKSEPVTKLGFAKRRYRQINQLREMYEVCILHMLKRSNILQ